MEFIDLKAQYKEIAIGLQKRLSDIMSESRFIMGLETTELEERLSAYVGVKHCVSCSNGTDALIMPLMAWGVGKGDAVFLPSFTFFATAEAVSLTGATPVFVDSDPSTFNIDTAKLKRSIVRVTDEKLLRPRAIISVDLFGQPAPNDEIEMIAKDSGLLFLEDAAQGFGGRIGERRACSFGDVAATSFFPAKPLGCYGDGGAIFTDNDDLADTLRSIRVHGQGREKYHNIRLGLNARLDNIQAAVLLEKLIIFDRENRRKNEIASLYDKYLGKLLLTPKVRDGYFSSWAQYTLITKGPEQRKRIMDHLTELSIPSAIYYKTPLHKQPVYRGYYPADDLSVSEMLSECVLSLPMHAYLSDEEVHKILEAISEAVS